MRSSRAFGICLHGIGPAVNDVLAYVPVHDVVTLVMYLQAQYFYGYGESLLEYNQLGSSFRVGFALYR